MITRIQLMLLELIYVCLIVYPFRYAVVVVAEDTFDENRHSLTLQAASSNVSRVLQKTAGIRGISAPSDQTAPIPPIRTISNNIFGPGDYPLALCKGPCQTSQDCSDNLVCFQRQQPYTSVPGCSGGAWDRSVHNFCIHPDSVIPFAERFLPPVTSSPFRLKLYWEPGYYWQESYKELVFCMMYNYRSGPCWYGNLQKPCDQDAVYISKCSEDARQIFAFEYLPGGEVLIKLSRGHNTCLERSKNSIYLNWCDATLPLQRWYAPNGDFNGYKFEFSQYGYEQKCITQAHHPKEGEVVELYSCSRTRDYQTSFWNRF